MNTVNLTPLDIGFDVRVQDMAIRLPDVFHAVVLDVDGKTRRIEGTREEMVAAIQAAGYRVQN